MRYAEEKGLDLIEVVPNANPPVCKILDYTKYKYEQIQKVKQERKKLKVFQVVKQIRIRPKIGEHDLQIKINHIKEFLKEKFKVKITLMFFGRELEHQDLGYKIIGKIKDEIKELGVFEQEPMMEGDRIVGHIIPLKKQEQNKPESNQNIEVS